MVYKLHLADKQLKLTGDLESVQQRNLETKFTQCLSKPTGCCSSEPCLRWVQLLENKLLWASANSEQSHLRVPMDTLLHWLDRWLLYDTVVTLGSVSDTSILKSLMLYGTWAVTRTEESTEIQSSWHLSYEETSVDFFSRGQGLENAWIRASKSFGPIHRSRWCSCSPHPHSVPEIPWVSGHCHIPRYTGMSQKIYLAC
jgi:hypothetical protein